MSKVLNILKYPTDEKILRKKSFKVEATDSLFKQFIGDLSLTLESSENGIGLSAVQVGVLKNVFVINLRDGNPTQVYVNPKILEFSEEKIEITEGCLSLENFSRKTLRSKEIEVKYQNLDKSFTKKKLEGLEAVVFQHEFEHLQGKLLLDYKE